MLVLMQQILGPQHALRGCTAAKLYKPKLNQVADLPLVMAAVSVVLPWSTCPMVPMFIWGLSLEKTLFASAAYPLCNRGTAHWQREKGWKRDYLLDGKDGQDV